MPLDRRRKVTLAIGATGLAAVGATAGYLLLREDPKGELLCPATPRFTRADLEEGDFVVIQLGAIDRSFSEATWARVLGRTWLGLGSGIRIEIDSQLGGAGDPTPLATDKHGFEVGQELVVEPRCVWDRYRRLRRRASLICGPSLMLIPADLGIPTAPDTRAKALQVGDAAAVVVGAHGRPVELLWLRITSGSPGGQVLVGEIVYDTESPELHGLSKGMSIEFVRDCVVETDIGGT